MINFCKKYWLYIVFIALAIFVVATQKKPLGGDKITETDFISSISATQAITKGHYKQILPTTTKIDGKDVTYKVTEYQNSKGEIGYQTVIYYPDRIKSINVGVETYRNFEIFYPNSSTSTTP